MTLWLTIKKEKKEIDLFVCVFRVVGIVTVADTILDIVVGSSAGTEGMVSELLGSLA
jgi:hypothetical protein